MVVQTLSNTHLPGHQSLSSPGLHGPLTPLLPLSLGAASSCHHCHYCHIQLSAGPDSWHVWSTSVGIPLVLPTDSRKGVRLNYLSDCPSQPALQLVEAWSHLETPFCRFWITTIQSVPVEWVWTTLFDMAIWPFLKFDVRH